MCDALRELMKPEMEEAVEKATDNNRVETAERMIHKDKYSDTEIADISGLTVKQVQKIKRRNTDNGIKSEFDIFFLQRY